jgi:muramidase (phage lysozyme)
MSTTSDSNLRAFLMAIRAAEGTLGHLGYRALFGFNPKRGGPIFDSYATHPRILRSFTDHDGKVHQSSAAGAYQILAPTFDDLVMRYKDEWTRLTRLSGGGFTPEVQDWMATQLIRQVHALDDVEAGRIGPAVEKCGTIWASLPSARYKQPMRSWHFVLAAYTDAGGQFEGPETTATLNA